MNPKWTAAVSRIYTKEGQSLKFLLAEYKRPSTGLYHNPMNCYHSPRIHADRRRGAACH